jgi:hypothetical protein
VPVLDATTGKPLGRSFEIAEETVLARLQAAGVIVIPIKLGFGPGLDATGQATRIAAWTGGEVIGCPSPDLLSATVYAALKRLAVPAPAQVNR